MGGGTQVLHKQLIEFIALEYHPSICGTGKCNQIHQNLLSYGYTLTKVNGQCIYHLPDCGGSLNTLGDLKANCNWDD